MSEKSAKKGFGKLWILAAVVVVVAGPAVMLVKRGGADGAGSSGATFDAKRTDLKISVVENGTVQAQDAVEIKSEVDGSTTIISIVDEGTQITEEDVANGKILVELDSADIKERLTQQRITFNGAESDFTEAKEALAIQKNLNESNIQKGLLDVTFARMEVEKYLGESLAAIHLNKADPNALGEIDPMMLIRDPNRLGGKSRQEYKKLTSDIDLAGEKLAQAETTLDWTRKLYAAEYVPESDLKKDKLAFDQQKSSLEQANIALGLFMQYDFAMEAKRLFSDYVEAQRELERIKAKARSELSQREARLRSAEAKYDLQKERLEKLEYQFAACTIRAPAPGMVVYASNRSRWGGSRTSIEPGETVHRRQDILSLPNASKMAVEIKVHEVNVDKVDPGQKCLITIDARPDTTFTGVVDKIAPLPDPQNWLTNPDLKVYNTDVSIDGQNEGIRPGMSAKVEIQVAHLNDVICVPVQCVANRGGNKVVFVPGPSGPQMRDVVTGQFNDTFVQIVEGVQEGEKVLLNPPRLIQADSGSRAKKPDKRPVKG